MRRGGLRRAVPALALAVTAVTALTGCGSDDDKPRAPDEKGARAAVLAYVDALNSRDAAALMEAGGVTADREAEREAERILTERGGRGLTVEKVSVSFGYGPDVGSARLTTKDRSGTAAAESLTVKRNDGRWRVVVFGDLSGGNKTESSVTPP
ncbi:YybH family protein [Streptomyces tsukubensis]|uniref:YybH family protein n=1 Tax=Streptomyces tsukubensis TaxID=83656 RepID=UPI00344F2E38